MNAPVLVVADLSCSPENIEEFAAVMREFAAACRAEPGCLSYEIFQSVDQPERYLNLETYADADAFAAHRASPHFRELGMARLLPLTTTREVRMYDQPREVTPKAD